MDQEPCAEAGELSRTRRVIQEGLAAAVAAGFGQWVDSPTSTLGRSIYRLAHGPVTLLLAAAGLLYDGPALPFACRYAEIKHIGPLNLDAPTSLPADFSGIELALWEIPERLHLQLPSRICADVARVVGLIVRDLD